MEKKQTKPIDLSEYEEEGVPFKEVIRQLGGMKVPPKASPPQKPQKTAKKRK